MKRLSKQQAVSRFIEITDGLPAISSYSASYRVKNDRYPFSEEPRYSLLGVEEELVESITAYLLGYTVQLRGGKALFSVEPFADRPEVKDFISDYVSTEVNKS